VPRFAANLSMLFPERPFLERFAAAAAAGFPAVECLWPYAYAPGELAARLDDAGLTQVLLNSPSGDTDAGERGLAALPGREEEFRRGVETALVYADALRCPRVHIMAGVPGPEVDRARAEELYRENLRWAASTARGTGVTLLLEPLNAFDVPGYFLGTLAHARAVLDDLADPGVALQLDWYHAARTEPDVVAATRRHLDATAHLQLAGVPGRHEPDVGDVDYPTLFALVDDTGYPGWIGCEYVPLGRTEDGLGWLHRIGGAPAPA
jgi:hydroxypyruvate isomerase